MVACEDIGSYVDRLEMNEAFLDKFGEVRKSEHVSLLEVVWLEVRDSTDQDERSSDLGLCDFMVTLLSRVDTRYWIVSSSGSDLWFSWHALPRSVLSHS